MTTPDGSSSGTPAAGGSVPDTDPEVGDLARLVMRLAADIAPMKTRLAHVEDRQELLACALDDIEQLIDVEIPLPAPLADGWHDIGGDELPTMDAVDQPGSGENQDADEEPGLDMRRLVAWVRDNVALLLERKVPQTGGAPMWCRSWWLHPEAIARFEAARRSWSEAVAEPTGNGLVVYFEHLDHQLGVLCAETGPFNRCKGGERHNDPTAEATAVLGQTEPDEWHFLDFEDETPTSGHNIAESRRATG